MMDALYSKLYDKYNKLKAKKFEELEQPVKDQEEKFLNYINTAEELIEFLTNEKAKVTELVNKYRDEVYSLRSLDYEKSVEHQNQLMEHSQKIQELKVENERLLKLSTDLKVENERLSKLQQEEKVSTMNDVEMEALDDASEGNQAGPEKTPRRRRSNTKAKSRRDRHSGSEVNGNVQAGPMTVENSRMDIHRETMSNDASTDMQLPECCWNVNTPGEDGNAIDSANCVYQAFLESLVGMKLSASKKSQGMCISAAHESSGYSFQLTWVYMASKQQAELLYTVKTLGTLSRIAPEWMREEIMFSINMCPVFFQRISRFIHSNK